MSAKRLQQIAVRLHHDPNFVEAVYEDPSAALLGEGLGPNEQAMLLAVDRRAWKSDPGRTDRVFEALRIEYPASLAWLEVNGVGRRSLLAFFSSSWFHGTIRDEGILALAFGVYLENLTPSDLPWARALAALELAFAKARRAADTRPPGPGPAATTNTSSWIQGPHLILHHSPTGTLDFCQHLRSWLGEGGEGRPPKPCSDLRSQPAKEWLCIEHLGQGALQTGALPDALGTLLSYCREPQRVLPLKEKLIALGCDEDDWIEVLNDLSQDHLLVRA